MVFPIISRQSRTKSDFMNRTAYIAGKITGLPKGQVKDKFNIMANELTGMGYNVVKPIAVTDD